MLVCEDCGGKSEGDGNGWVAVRLERPNTTEILTYCPSCACQFEPDDTSPADDPS